MSVSTEEDINHKVIQGDSWQYQFQYATVDTDQYGVETIYPIDITGYIITMEVRDKPDGRILCATCTENDGLTIDYVNGIVDIDVVPAKTKKFTYPRAAYQIQGRNEAGDRLTFMKGWFTVDLGIVA